MSRIQELRNEVRRCEMLLARHIPLGRLGQMLVWPARVRARRALGKAKALLAIPVENDAGEQPR